MALAIFFFVRRFRSGSEIDAALITVSAAAVIGFARGASTDMELSAPFCIAMLAWWAWHATNRRRWLAAAYALLAVGALGKGPISPALAILIVAAYAWLLRDFRIVLRTLWLPGIALFCAIAFPWYIAVQLKVPIFFNTFFLQHNLERFSTNLYQHSQPFWYYVPVFLLSVVPWVVFTVPALVSSIGKGISFVNGRKNLREEQPSASISDANHLDSFLTMWILVPIVFFSISRSKLPGYILPAIPAATMLTAIDLHRRNSIARVQVMLHSLVCAAVVAGALFAPWRMIRTPLPNLTRAVIVVSAALVAVFVLLLVRSAGLRRLQFATLGPTAVALIFLLRPAAPVVDQSQSARTVNAALNAALAKVGAAPETVAVSNVRRETEYGLDFYRHHPIPRYERDGIPQGRHALVAKAGSTEAIQASVGNRDIQMIGSFPPQRLEFYLIGPAR
jgi:4-amino-4-deoxy-L-arabinose transferase-like glycosyltransferase